MTENQDLSQQIVEKYLKLATIWQTKGKLSQAIANCEKAIQILPDHLLAQLTLTKLLALTGQRKEAINTYHQAMAKATEQAWIFSPKFSENQGKFANSKAFISQVTKDYQASIKQRISAQESKHILLYTNCPGTYGAEQVSHALMVHLIKLGYQVTCVQSWADHHLIRVREALGIKHIWLKDNAHKFLYSATNVSEVAKIFSSLRPDLIIFADGGPCDNLAANWLAMYVQIPYIRIIHCVILDWAKEFEGYLCLLPTIYQAAKAIISVSQVNLEQMRETFELPEHLGQVIYNGRPDEYFAPRRRDVRDRLRRTLNIADDATVIFTAARMETVKGYQHQIKAIQQLKEQSIWSQFYFVWAGTGTLENRLKADIEQLGVGEKVKFLGERADIADLLEASDIFLLPSHFEGMPLAIMEAMAKGLPIMATKISGIPEELGDTGQLLPDPNINPDATVQGFIETLQTWATAPETCRILGQRCQERAKTLFAEKQMLDGYFKLIQQILSN